MEDAAQAPGMDPNRKRRSNTWIYAVIIVFLLCTNVYLFLQKDKNQQKLNDTKQQLQQADTNLSKLQSDYNASLARLDELTGKNAQLDRQLMEKNSELSRTKMRIQQILDKRNATEKEIAEARALIQKLNNRIGVYEEEIAKLKQENTSLSRQRDSVAVSNTDLQQKVDLAKVLHASNIRLKGIKLTHGGRKEKETEKARRVDLLRVLFDIDENRIAENGAKELNICIINPEGNLLSNAALGSGSFRTADGASRYYSVSKNVLLQTEQPLKDVVVDWQQSAEYAKGSYTVEIYHQGYLIGKGSVSLR